MSSSNKQITNLVMTKYSNQLIKAKVEQQNQIVAVRLRFNPSVKRELRFRIISEVKEMLKDYGDKVTVK